MKNDSINETDTHFLAAENGKRSDDLYYAEITPDQKEFHRADSGVSVASSVKHESSVLFAFLTFFKSFIGSGILTLPFNFHHLGVIPTFFSFLFLALLTWYCMRIVAEAADRVNLRKTDF